MKTIDVLGQPCPIPVIKAKKALGQADVEAVTVKVDNIVAVQNLEKMARGYGYDFSYQEVSPGLFDVLIVKSGAAAPAVEEERSEQGEVRPSAAPERMVVVIGKDGMGAGSDELGKILVKGFIYSLTELKTPPESILFLNSGVFLTAEGSNAIDDLKRLEAAGTNILSCGTCINYFELQGKLAVGSVADMYGITEKMARASNTISI